MNDAAPHVDVAIVGGGIAGVVLSIALIKRGIDVQIFEQARHFGEIGAGVAFSPAAIRAMKVCAPEVYSAFEEVSTLNQSEEKKNVWFDWLDGVNDKSVGKVDYCFSITNETGSNAVHRAHLLDNLVKAVPEAVTHFRKHVDTIKELSDGKLQLMFHDGTTTTANAVIGCDGIKSQVRAWMVGEEHPSAHPSYTHKYAYRGLVPMDKARRELGDDLAQNAKMFMGKDGHVLTFPVDHGETFNMVAFKVDPGEWPSSDKLTLPATREQVLEDFKGFGQTVHKIIEMLEPQLDRWAIFDTGSHPMPFYNKGKVVVIGDAGHATSPHHGAGAGMCIEDAAILAELLADSRVAQNGDKGLAQAFQAYNDQRLDRTQWLVQSSRRSGDLYEWRAESVGRDIDKIQEECRWRDEKIWNGQVSEYIQDGKQMLGKLLYT